MSTDVTLLDGSHVMPPAGRALIDRDRRGGGGVAIEARTTAVAVRRVDSSHSLRALLVRVDGRRWWWLVCPCVSFLDPGKGPYAYLVPSQAKEVKVFMVPPDCVYVCSLLMSETGVHGPLMVKFVYVPGACWWTLTNTASVKTLLPVTNTLQHSTRLPAVKEVFFSLFTSDRDRAVLFLHALIDLRTVCTAG